MNTFVGTVVSGKQQARTLGYPTANLEYQSDTPPERGVWSCTVKWNTIVYNGLAVIGMWNINEQLPSLEVHILDFSDDVYGQRIEVALHAKLRDLLPFTDVETLKKQIVADIDQAHLVGF